MEWDPDSKVHGANMGPIWGQQDPGGPHVGPMNFAIWGGNNIATSSWTNVDLLSTSSLATYFRGTLFQIQEIHLKMLYA